MNRRALAIFAAIGATIIYGLNHTIAKGVMPIYITPFAFIFLRVSGAAILFWIISFLVPNEKIALKDRGRFILCAVLGMGINMFSFFKGLELSTPINSAVLVTVTPIIVVILSALFIEEKITLRKGSGIALGFLGALGLILFGAEIRRDAPNIPLGNVLLVLNSITYGAYLIFVKTLIQKYHPFTVMKWLFTIGIIIDLPIAYPDLIEVQWAQMPLEAIGAILFVVVCTTFLTYLFNIYALTQLKASTVSAFVYVQPLIGILFALATGKDDLTAIKVVATVLVLVGVYLASRRPSGEPSP